MPLRERVIAQNDRAYESLTTARGFRDKATRLQTVRVAGDRERERQAEREAQDKIISKGSRVVDFAFGPGVIVGVFLKSYRVQFDRGYTHARDKTYVRLEVR